MDFYEKILDWPAIIQGLLGSFLFWFIIYIGQKITRYFSKKISKDKETATYFAKAYYAARVDDPIRIQLFTSVVYGAIHYFLKASLVMVITMWIGEALPIFQHVGYLITVYFLFRSLSYLPHLSIFGSKEDAQKNLILEMNKKKSI